MSYVASTFFDADTWNKFGLNWVRSAKSASLDCLIIGDELPEEAISKINELKFRHVPIIKKFKNKCNIEYTLIQNLDKNTRCLWTKPEILPKSGIVTNSDLVCGYTNLVVQDLASAVINLYDRAAMIESLNEQIQKVHGRFLSSDFMLGTYDFWNGFFGCKAYLFGKKYLENNGQIDDLVLNFFVAFANSLSLEIKESY